MIGESNTYCVYPYAYSILHILYNYMYIHATYKFASVAVIGDCRDGEQQEAS